MEINKPTDELDSILANMKPDQLDEFFNAYGKGVADEKKAFYYYYTGVLKDKRIKLKDVYSFAGESESYGGQIVRMEKRTKDRDIAAVYRWPFQPGGDQPGAKTLRDAGTVFQEFQRCVPDRGNQQSDLPAG